MDLPDLNNTPHGSQQQQYQQYLQQQQGYAIAAGRSNEEAKTNLGSDGNNHLNALPMSANMNTITGSDQRLYFPECATTLGGRASSSDSSSAANQKKSLAMPFIPKSNKTTNKKRASDHQGPDSPNHMSAENMMMDASMSVLMQQQQQQSPYKRQREMNTAMNAFAGELQAPSSSMHAQTTNFMQSSHSNWALQQQQQDFGNTPLPRAPTSPGGGWNTGMNLANLQQQQQQQQQLQQQLQQQQQSFNAPQVPSLTGMGGTGLGGAFSSGSSNLGMMSGSNNALLGGGDDSNMNNAWAADFLLRSNQGAGGAAGINNNPNNMSADNMDGSSLISLQLIRQQQERMRQTQQQVSEETAMRRQLQMLRNGGGNAMPTFAGSNAGIGAGNHTMGFPSSHHPVDTPSSFNAGNPFGNFSADMGLGGNNNMMLQHQFSQQQHQQSQQQSQFDLFSHQEQQGYGMPNLLDGQAGAVRRNTAPTGTLSSSSSSKQEAPSAPGFRRAASLSSTVARATPMLGPICQPVTFPPQDGTYCQLPPIEEGEIRHYDQRAHVPLAMEEDQNWLSEFQCFVRKELLQVFRASHQDVKIRVASKKVYYEQVGIRCRYCAHWKPSTRAIRSSAFPSSIRQLYQSFTMMLRDHFGNCPAIPAEKKERFLALKRNNTQGASDSMRYWIYSATKLGMVDSDCGIVLNENTQAAARNKPPFGTAESGNTTTADSPPRLLVKPEDLEQNVIESEFLYTLLTQYQLIRLLPTECIGNRKSLRPGVPGLGCRYCCQAGRLGLSRVFPAKKKQLPAQIQDLYDHIRRCNLCPTAVKEGLQRSKESHDRQRFSDESGSGDVDETANKRKIVGDDDKGFVELLWQRLGHRGELATPIAS